MPSTPRLVLLGALLAGGCGQARMSDPPAPSPEMVEQARRDERQKIMQEYWYEHTGAAQHPQAVEPDAGPSLNYPAGTYGGVRFGPRQAADASLAEPRRGP